MRKSIIVVINVLISVGLIVVMIVMKHNNDEKLHAAKSRIAFLESKVDATKNQLATANNDKKEVYQLDADKKKTKDAILALSDLTNKDKTDFVARVIDAKTDEELRGVVNVAKKQNDDRLTETKKKAENEKRKKAEEEKKAKEKAEQERKTNNENNDDTKKQSSTSSPQLSSKPKVGSSKTVVPTALDNNVYNWAQSFEMTYIGDSLGVGARPYLAQYFPKANFDVLSSRFLINNVSSSLNGYQTLVNLKQQNALKQNVVIALGTNGGFSDGQLDSFIRQIPSDFNVILISTRSNVGYRVDVANKMKNYANNHNNVYMIDWNEGVNNWGWSSIVAGDSIHMSNYQPYAQFQLQGLYQLFR